MDKVLELNKILDEEIEFCEQFEDLLQQKKTVLIHSQASRLKDFDEKIYNAHKKLQELNQKRIKLTQKFGGEKVKLSDIIGSIENQAEAKKLEEKRKKLQVFAQKISIINKVINSLIEHSLKMIDGSITTIAQAMAKSQTKGDYYDKHGVTAKQHENICSAIIEEA